MTGPRPEGGRLLGMWEVLLLVGVLRVNIVIATCTFPKYLTPDPNVVWQSQIRLRGYASDRQHYFNGHIMKVLTLDPVSTWTTYTCELLVTEERIIVSHQTNGAKELTFTCFRFVQRSSHVLQLARSEIGPRNPSAQPCSDENLVFDRWPLVWTTVGVGHYEPCPAIGGFDMKVLDTAGNAVCDYSSPAPRFESECIYGEGINIRFESIFCRGDIPMLMEERLFCLGHWQQGYYTNVVVTDNKDFPKIWMLQYVANDNTTIMYIKESVTVDLRGNISGIHWQLELTRKTYGALCLDDFEECDSPTMCTGFKSHHCLQTCNNYSRCSIGERPCRFENAFQGNWLDNSKIGTSNVTVRNHTIEVGRVKTTFTCLALRSRPHSRSKPIYKVFTNGCKPRYGCVDMEIRDRGLMLYRLSQSAIWPFRKAMVRGDLCSSVLFKDDPMPLAATFRQQHFKLLIQDHQRTSRRTVGCNLSTDYTFNATWSSGRSCKGTMRRCLARDVMVLTFDRSCNLSLSRVFYRCLAEYEINLQQFIFTERTDDAEDTNCWVFREAVTKDMLQLHSGDCNNRTIISINGDVHNIPYIVHLKLTSIGDKALSVTHSCLDMPVTRGRQQEINSSSGAASSSGTSTSDQAGGRVPAEITDVSETNTTPGTLPSTVTPIETSTLGTPRATQEKGSPGSRTSLLNVITSSATTNDISQTSSFKASPPPSPLWSSPPSSPLSSSSPSSLSLTPSSAPSSSPPSLSSPSSISPSQSSSSSPSSPSLSSASGGSSSSPLSVTSTSSGTLSFSAGLSSQLKPSMLPENPAASPKSVSTSAPRLASVSANTNSQRSVDPRGSTPLEETRTESITSTTTTTSPPLFTTTTPPTTTPPTTTPTTTMVSTFSPTTTTPLTTTPTTTMVSTTTASTTRPPTFSPTTTTPLTTTPLTTTPSTTTSPPTTPLTTTPLTTMASTTTPSTTTASSTTPTTTPSTTTPSTTTATSTTPQTTMASTATASSTRPPTFSPTTTIPPTTTPLTTTSTFLPTSPPLTSTTQTTPLTTTPSTITPPTLSPSTESKTMEPIEPRIVDPLTGSSESSPATPNISLNQSETSSSPTHTLNRSSDASDRPYSPASDAHSSLHAKDPETRTPSKFQVVPTTPLIVPASGLRSVASGASRHPSPGYMALLLVTVTICWSQ